MSTPTWDTLSLDQTLALRHAATRLAGEFDSTFGTRTIERCLHSYYHRFADRATVTKFLPLMAERFARQRLRALAKIEGLHDDGKPTVLFLKPWTDETVWFQVVADPADGRVGGTSVSPCLNEWVGCSPLRGIRGTRADPRATGSKHPS